MEPRCWSERLSSFQRTLEPSARRSVIASRPPTQNRCDPLAVLANRGAGFLFSQERRARDPSFQRMLEPSARRSVIASRPPTQKPMRPPRRAGEPRRWVPVFTGTTSSRSVVPAHAGTQREAIDYRLAASYAKADAAPSPCWPTEALGSCFHRNDELAIRRSSERWNPARGDRLSPRGLLRNTRCGGVVLLVNGGAGFLFSQERRVESHRAPAIDNPPSLSIPGQKADACPASA
ncbi:MAG: hypothetical protein GAK28_02846 [Luteibacter sp.]|nr:MAG: hypothetical protein GAK28_02846 [Luteibacter sp.]